MSFSVLVNLLTMLLCGAVTIQSLRMMRSLKALRQGDLGQMVAALDKASVTARIILCDLKGTLAQCGDRKADVGRAAALAEELSMMIELADARAERLATAAPLPAPPTRPARPRGKAPTGTKEKAAKTARVEASAKPSGRERAAAPRLAKAAAPVAAPPVKKPARTRRKVAA